jgi:hypothetical protein
MCATPRTDHAMHQAQIDYRGEIHFEIPVELKRHATSGNPFRMLAHEAPEPRRCQSTVSRSWNESVEMQTMLAGAVMRNLAMIASH